MKKKNRTRDGQKLQDDHVDPSLRYKMKSMINKKRKKMFYLLMFLILSWLIVGEFLYPNEQTESSRPEHVLYTGTFTWEKPDGTKEAIAVPGKYEVPAGETMVIVTQLPDDYQENAIGLRSSLQDVKIYIDGELRCSYDTKETRPFGKNSASRYVLCSTSEKDAGRELRIELTTYTDNYSGVVNEVYCGDKGDIWAYIFSEYRTETLIGFFILFAGIVTIIFSMALGIVYKVQFDMEYLGWCMLLGAIWMLGESKLRQLWISNASVLASMCFIVIMLCPIPLLLYIDSVQRGRYTKLYHIMEGVACLNFLISTILQLSGKLDYIETMPAGHVIMVLTFFLILGTFIRDIRGGESHSYHLVLTGVLAAMVAVLIEAVSVYFVVLISGIVIGIGLLVLLFMNIVRTMKSVRDMELQRQKEEVEKRRRQTEKMALQMIRTLSTTLEAKDEYINGHSYRVAQYAALIAREMGWSQKEVLNLKNAAYLHDVGKIGIPDTILNKPSRLTEEEYDLIKAHTVIGADILKDITMIEHVVDVARYHHERYDGSGYPDGLVGEEIPIHARIVAVADSYDAMNSRRIYRSALPVGIIYEEIQKNRGIQFDPNIADVFLSLMKEGKLNLEEAGEEQGGSDEMEDLERETGKFLSDVMATMRSQEDNENYDYLTGLFMRSKGEVMIAQLMQEHPGCLVFLDMDNLKKINDIYGHRAGDRALKLLGNLIADSTCGHVGCRFGGDEFVLFFQNVNKEEATDKIAMLFQRFREDKEADAEIRCASLSAGMCMTSPGDTFESCYLNADKALYYVKQNGKDQFCFYHEMEENGVPDTPAGRDLKKVAKALQESGSYSGALDMDFRGFARIYEYMNSLGARYRYACYLVMVTMDTMPEQTMYMESIEEALGCMEKAIRQKIRKVDICTRYSAMQYLIILFEPEESQIPKVMERIFMQYYKIYEKNDFKPWYEYIPMLEKKNDIPDGNSKI